MKATLQQWHHYLHQHAIFKYPYKILVILAGICCLVIGVVLLVLPGPGLLFIFFGLVILSIEIPYFKKVTDWLYANFVKIKTTVQSKIKK